MRRPTNCVEDDSVTKLYLSHSSLKHFSSDQNSVQHPLESSVLCVKMASSSQVLASPARVTQQI
jgi:hypothetical protein